MDDFLIGLYEEEQEKVAAADLGDFMDTLPANELEEFLGLTKAAVAGPPEPQLPSGAEKLSKEQKKTDAEVAKMQDQGTPNRKEAMVRRIKKLAAKSSPEGAQPDEKKKKKLSEGLGEEDPGMETTAAVKAGIAMRAMRVTRGAPPHIKLAAARFAGNEIAKTG